MLKKDLDTADIVRDGLLNEAALRQSSQSTISRVEGASSPNRLRHETMLQLGTLMGDNRNAPSWGKTIFVDERDQLTSKGHFLAQRTAALWVLENILHPQVQ